MPWIIAAIAVLAVVALAGLILWRKRSRRPPAGFTGADTYRSLFAGAAPQAAPPADGEKMAELRQNLRVKMLYQEEKIDAAIEFERQRDPAASLPRLMQAAIDRWERDNR